MKSEINVITDIINKEEQKNHQETSRFRFQLRTIKTLVENDKILPKQCFHCAPDGTKTLSNYCEQTFHTDMHICK